MPKTIKIPTQAESKSKIKLSGKRKVTKPININNFNDGDYRLVNIETVHPDPDQPREIFDENALEELANSIKQEGVLQPIIIRFDESNKIWLVAGERRFRASKMAGLKQIPAVITTKENYREIQLIENIQRDDLKPIEEAKAYKKLIDDFSYSHQALAEKLGKSKTVVTRTLSLNRLPDSIKKECINSSVSKRTLIEIAQKKNSNEQLRLFEQAKHGGINSQQVRIIDRKKPIPPRPNVLITMEKLKSLEKSFKKVLKEDINIEEAKLLLIENDKLEKTQFDIKNKLKKIVE